MISQKGCPLATFRDFRCLIENINDGKAILCGKSHVHSRHQRKMEVHVTQVAFAKIGRGIFRPLIGLSKQHAIGVVRVYVRAQLPQVLVGLGKVFAIGSFSLIEVRNSIKPEPVNTHAKPEIQYIGKCLVNFRIFEIEIGLVMEKPMPVILARNSIPRPV